MKKVNDIPAFYDDPESIGYKKVLDDFLRFPEETDVAYESNLKKNRQWKSEEVQFSRKNDKRLVL